MKLLLPLLLFGVLSFTQASDLVKHNVRTQSVCTEVTFKRPTRDCRWHADLDYFADQEILGCKIIAYKIQWFRGGWSGWFVPGINDIDGKVNLHQRTCNGGVIQRNTMRRWWSYFYDHNHRYIQCCARKPILAPKKVPFYRYYHGRIQDHFYTTNFNELKNGKHGWRYEGIQCKIHKDQSPGSSPLYRYWNGKDHFYTRNVNEIGVSTPGTRGRHGYVSEGIAGYCFATRVAGTIPLYRYWHARFINHFYTTNINEIGTHIIGQVGKHGYKSEGIACYVYPA